MYITNSEVQEAVNQHARKIEELEENITDLNNAVLILRAYLQKVLSVEDWQTLTTELAEFSFGEEER